MTGAKRLKNERRLMLREFNEAPFYPERTPRTRGHTCVQLRPQDTTISGETVRIKGGDGKANCGVLPLGRIVDQYTTLIYPPTNTPARAFIDWLG